MARKKITELNENPALDNVKNALHYIEIESSIFLSEVAEPEGFLPETENLETLLADTENSDNIDIEGSELDSFEAADIEDVEFVEEEQIHSIIESILFASDRPVSFAAIQLVKRT